MIRQSFNGPRGFTHVPAKHGFTHIGGDIYRCTEGVYWKQSKGGCEKHHRTGLPSDSYEYESIKIDSVDIDIILKDMKATA